MDIAEVSMGLSSVYTNIQAGTSILKYAMDMPKQSTEKLLLGIQEMRKELENLLQPYLGQNIDVYA